MWIKFDGQQFNLEAIRSPAKHYFINIDHIEVALGEHVLKTEKTKQFNDFMFSTVQKRDQFLEILNAYCLNYHKVTTDNYAEYCQAIMDMAERMDKQEVERNVC